MLKSVYLYFHIRWRWRSYSRFLFFLVMLVYMIAGFGVAGANWQHKTKLKHAGQPRQMHAKNFMSDQCRSSLMDSWIDPKFCILHLESQVRMNTPTWLISLKQAKRPIWLMHTNYDPVGGEHQCICKESNYSNFTELGQESQFLGRSRPEQHGKDNKKFPGEQCLLEISLPSPYSHSGKVANLKWWPTSNQCMWGWPCQVGYYYWMISFTLGFF